MLLALLVGAVCLVAPVDGPVVAEYAPIGSYAGHWGIDYAAPSRSPVRAPASGRVTFAGTVAGMKTVTIEPVPGFKVSLSYLSSISVSSGATVQRGDVVARSGSPHGAEGVHLSTRIDGEYVDPESQLGCRETDITRALRLVAPPGPYARSRAHRDPRGDIRPDTHRSSPRRGDRSSRRRSRPGPLHPGGRPLAEDRRSLHHAGGHSGGDDDAGHRRDTRVRARSS